MRVKGQEFFGISGRDDVLKVVKNLFQEAYPSDKSSWFAGSMCAMLVLELLEGGSSIRGTPAPVRGKYRLHLLYANCTGLLANHQTKTLWFDSLPNKELRRKVLLRKTSRCHVYSHARLHGPSSGFHVRKMPKGEAKSDKQRGRNTLTRQYALPIPMLHRPCMSNILRLRERSVLIAQT